MDVRPLHNTKRGKTCVVIGNGPSLDKTPIEKFSYDTLGSNMIYRRPFIPTYYACVDREMCEAIEEWPSTTCFLRAEFADREKHYPLYPIVANGFGVEIDNFVVIGGTVTYVLLQIAFYMGYSTVLLVGVDHYYPKSSQHGRHRFTARGGDPDHFTPADGKPYFLEGKLFNPPELEGTARSYAIAKDIYMQAKRRIINLTPGTKLDVFEKDKIENWI